MSPRIQLVSDRDVLAMKKHAVALALEDMDTHILRLEGELCRARRIREVFRDGIGLPPAPDAWTQGKTPRDDWRD